MAGHGRRPGAGWRPGRRSGRQAGSRRTARNGRIDGTPFKNAHPRRRGPGDSARAQPCAARPGARRAARRGHADQGCSSGRWSLCRRGRLPRTRLSSSQPPPLGRPYGPSHAIGYADPKRGDHSQGIQRLRGEMRKIGQPNYPAAGVVAESPSAGVVGTLP